MTSKELAELLKVSKRTINNKIKKLKIEPRMIGNRYDISLEDVEKIIRNIYKDDYFDFLQQAQDFYPTTSKTDAISFKSEQGENDIKQNENDIRNNENENKNIENNSEQNEQINEKSENSEKDITDKLIKMLEKSLEDKEQTIRAQQNQIDMLIKSNALLTQRLEDKQPQEKEVIVSESPSAAAAAKQSWFKRFFSHE
jgi:excisionase family DNA binding protein